MLDLIADLHVNFVIFKQLNFIVHLNFLPTTGVKILFQTDQKSLGKLLKNLLLYSSLSYSFRSL